MSIHEYVVRQQDGLWKVWLGEQLVSGQPTRGEAVNVAEALAHAASLRGEGAIVHVGESVDGLSVSFPAIQPADCPA